MVSLRDYSPDQEAAERRKMFKGFGWSVTETETTAVVDLTPAETVESPAELDEATEHALVDAGPMPYNALTGRVYTGKNVFALLIAEAEHDYNGGGWAGFGQWQKMGRVVRKGEHGTPITLVVTKKVDDEGRKVTRPTVKRVFHFAQTAELEQPAS